MNVLFVTPRVPWPPDHGGRIRTFEMLRGLQGARVHLVTGRTDADADPAALDAYVASVTAVSAPQARGPSGLGPKCTKWARALLGRSYLMPRITASGLPAAVAQACASNPIDVVVLDHTWVATVLPAVATGLPVLVSFHNVESSAVWVAAERRTGGTRWMARREARALERAERALVDRASACVVVSELDAERIRHFAGRDIPMHVLPNGAAVATTALLPPPTFSPLRLLYIGGYDYPPNADAARRLATEVLPILRRSIPNAEVHLVGSDPTDALAPLRGQPGVVLHGRVQDVVSVYAGMSALVVPLEEGGGSRLKVAEAWALGRPVVTTPVGIEGHVGQPDEHFVLGRTPEELAAGVLRLAANPDLVARLVASGRRLAEETLEWSGLTTRFRDLVVGLATGQKPDSAR